MSTLVATVNGHDVVYVNAAQKRDYATRALRRAILDLHVVLPLERVTAVRLTGREFEVVLQPARLPAWTLRVNFEDSLDPLVGFNAPMGWWLSAFTHTRSVRALLIGWLGENAVDSCEWVVGDV